MGDIVFPGEEHTDWLHNTKLSALKTFVRVASYGERVIFRKILVYTSTYATAVKREAEEQSGYMKGFGGQKGEEMMM